MKKLFMMIALVGGFVASSFANEYKIDDASVDQMFASATDISLTGDAAEMIGVISDASASELAGLSAAATSKGGYLLRAFFCGIVALHRSYMGATGLWWKYLCTNLIGLGGIIVGIDFWWVIFSDSALNKYKNNQKFLVFAGK